MTHSIGMRIGIKDYSEVQELKRQLLNPNENYGMLLYSMVNSDTNHGGLENNQGICPFIYFPEDRDDKRRGCYWVVVETGSHCAWTDLSEILYCWTFWVILKELLEAVCTDFTYLISEDGEDQHLTLGQAFSMIKKANPEFAALFPKGRLSNAIVRKGKTD